MPIRIESGCQNDKGANKFVLIICWTSPGTMIIIISIGHKSGIRQPFDVHIRILELIWSKL